MTSTLPRRTYLYFAAQSINLTTAVMSVTMAAIVGATLAPEARFSTVPYGFQFFIPDAGYLSCLKNDEPHRPKKCFHAWRHPAGDIWPERLLGR